MNPLILRGIRESLRTKHLIAAGLFSLIVCSTVYMTSYLEGSKGKYSYDSQTQEWTKEESSPINGARNAFTFYSNSSGLLLNVFRNRKGCLYYCGRKGVWSARLSKNDSDESICQDCRLYFRSSRP